MTIDVAGYMVAVIAIGISFVAARSSYWLLKFMAGVFWCAVALYWITNKPAGIVGGSPEDVVVVIALFFIGIAFMLMPFWYGKFGASGREEGGRFRLPFMQNDEEEESENKRRFLPTRKARVNAYLSRLEGGERNRRG